MKLAIVVMFLFLGVSSITECMQQGSNYGDITESVLDAAYGCDHNWLSRIDLSFTANRPQVIEKALGRCLDNIHCSSLLNVDDIRKTIKALIALLRESERDMVVTRIILQIDREILADSNARNGLVVARRTLDELLRGHDSNLGNYLSLAVVCFIAGYFTRSLTK